MLPTHFENGHGREEGWNIVEANCSKTLHGAGTENAVLFDGHHDRGLANVLRLCLYIVDFMHIIDNLRARVWC